MALPIKETPVLTGRDAAKFILQIYKSETKPITKKERQEYSQAKELYDRIQQKNKRAFWKMIKFEDCSNIRLCSEYKIKSFDCGDGDLNDFLFLEAQAHWAELFAVTYLFEYGSDTVAFFSVSNDKITYDEKTISKTEWNKFCRSIPNQKRRKGNPAVKIGRLGVCKKFQGNGIGTDLLKYIKYLFINNNKTGCRYITVDAYNNARTTDFYKNNGFIFLTEGDIADDTRLMYFDLKRFQDSARGCPVWRCNKKICVPWDSSMKLRIPRISVGHSANR